MSANNTTFYTAFYAALYDSHVLTECSTVFTPWNYTFLSTIKSTNKSAFKTPIYATFFISIF